MSMTKLAVPTMGQAGLDSERSGHFGKCDCFTLVTIDDGQITSVENIDNPPHEEGGCMRPFMGFTEAGIDVYFENETPRVGDVAELIAQGKVEKMTADNTCHH